jgi:hypothetical protein
LEAGTGIEPVYKDLQSSASPLCHPAFFLRIYFAIGFGQGGNYKIAVPVNRIWLVVWSMNG